MKDKEQSLTVHLHIDQIKMLRQIIGMHIENQKNLTASLYRGLNDAKGAQEEAELVELAEQSEEISEELKDILLRMSQAGVISDLRNAH